MSQSAAPHDNDKTGNASRSSDASAAFLTELKNLVRGSVKSDAHTLGIYSTDASHYQITPSVVVCPQDESDAITAVKIAGQHGISITARGGGTSLSGQTTWNGMILDCSRHLNQVLEINESEQWVRVQPGVVRDQLNAQLKPLGLHFAPDPATTSRATVGGMIGNNSSGVHSVLYGKTSDNVISTKVVLSDGTVLEAQPMDLRTWKSQESGTDRVAEIYRGVHQIVATNQDEIEKRFPKIMRRVAGYGLDAFLIKDDLNGSPNKETEANWNLSNLIIGAEGTLGVLLEAKLRLQPLPAATAVCVVHFDDRIQSLAAIDAILEHGPAAIELLDYTVVKEAKQNRSTADLATFFVGDPQAVQIVEFFGDSAAEVQTKVNNLIPELQSNQIGYAWLPRFSAEELSDVWQLRKLGLGLIFNQPGVRRSVTCIEDASVPTDRLAEYMQRVLEICQSHGIELCLYGHSSVGVIHARPRLDLHKPSDVQLMETITREVFAACQEFGGCFSGEHGDGLLRGQFVQPFYGPQIYEAFRQIKSLFDPANLMNPGKIVDSPAMTDNMRFGNGYAPSVDSMFHYRDQGGMVGAIEQCVGVGACRKLKSGTMCPSFMATKDEEHTTRGRANALRLAISGQLGEDALTGERMQDALKLCLSCKACKSECPTAVDMSRLKADVTHLRHKKHGVDKADKLLGTAPKVAKRFAGRWARLFNWIQRRSFTRGYLNGAGVDPRRPLPELTSQTFEMWWNARESGSIQSAKNSDATLQPVLLFIDTFTNYYEPEVGQAAVELLQACGFSVDVIAGKCCQRPQISRGLLDMARKDGGQTIQLMSKAGVQEDTPILMLEPSCASAITDDLPDLIKDESVGRSVSNRTQMLDVFLADEISSGRLQVKFESLHDDLLIHGHCHQKALYGTASMKTIFASVEGLKFSEIDAGCCGMAGSFGYQNHELSEKIGEDRLFPAVRDNPDSQVVACGISCRHQLHDFLNVKAKHWVQLIKVVEA